MLKSDELRLPSSCLNRARADEPIFVLLGRDIAAPTAIRAWCHARIQLGKNAEDDEQIREARDLALAIELLQRAAAAAPDPSKPV